MRSRLNEICAGIDRTADMGAFPHDEVAVPLDRKSSRKLLTVSGDSSADSTERDQAMWSLIYRETSTNRNKDLPDLLYTVAMTAKEAVLRRSSSWGLFKLGEVALLKDCLNNGDDGNVHSWKQHLIYEAEGRTDWIDPRPFRVVDSKLGYGVTLPLTIHGMVQFRTYDYSYKASQSAPQSYAPTSYSRVASYSPAGREDSNVSATPPSYGTPNPGAYTWHCFIAGPIAQRRLVGDLTAGVGEGAIYDNLTIQKVCTDPLGNGLDHVQGYLFQGMSRSLGGNALAHYYTSRGLQPFYLSGRIADASAGVVHADTSLVRHAETNIVTNDEVPYPFVQSVRGLFYGPANMNTIVARDAKAPLDNLLQIVKEPYANGYFFGEFRSVPVDVDGDGHVEINGMEMYTDLAGQVTERTPPGPQGSLAFAR